MFSSFNCNDDIALKLINMSIILPLALCRCFQFYFIRLGFGSSKISFQCLVPKTIILDKLTQLVSELISQDKTLCFLYYAFDTVHWQSNFFLLVFFHVNPWQQSPMIFLFLLLLYAFSFRIVNSSNQIKITVLAHVGSRFNNTGHVYEMFRWPSTLSLFYCLREWDSRGQIFSIETVAKRSDIFHLFSIF